MIHAKYLHIGSGERWVFNPPVIQTCAVAEVKLLLSWLRKRVPDSPLLPPLEFYSGVGECGFIKTDLQLITKMHARNIIHRTLHRTASLIAAITWSHERKKRRCEHNGGKREQNSAVHSVQSVNDGSKHTCMCAVFKPTATHLKFIKLVDCNLLVLLLKPKGECAQPWGTPVY